MAALAAERFGGLDVLVNNAAIDNFEPLDEISEATWRHVLEVNLDGTFMLTRELLPQLRASPAGAIVNVASAAALIGTPGMAAYTASKGALVSLTRQLAIEYARDGLRVNSVCPGSIDTPMFRKSLGDRGDAEAGASRARRAAPARADRRPGGRRPRRALSRLGRGRVRHRREPRRRRRADRALKVRRW